MTTKDIKVSDLFVARKVDTLSCWTFFREYVPYKKVAEAVKSGFCIVCSMDDGTPALKLSDDAKKLVEAKIKKLEETSVQTEAQQPEEKTGA